MFRTPSWEHQSSICVEYWSYPSLRCSWRTIYHRVKTSRVTFYFSPTKIFLLVSQRAKVLIAVPASLSDQRDTQCTVKSVSNSLTWWDKREIRPNENVRGQLDLVWKRNGSHPSSLFVVAATRFHVFFVWTIRGKLIRTVLCCAVYDSGAWWYAHA